MYQSRAQRRTQPFHGSGSQEELNNSSAPPVSAEQAMLGTTPEVASTVFNASSISPAMPPCPEEHEWDRHRPAHQHLSGVLGPLTVLRVLAFAAYGLIVHPCTSTDTSKTSSNFKHSVQTPCSVHVRCLGPKNRSSRALIGCVTTSLQTASVAVQMNDFIAQIVIGRVTRASLAFQMKFHHGPTVALYQ